MIDILSVACCSVQFPDKDWIESKVNLASIVPLRPFRRCLILISLLTQKVSLSIRSRLWILWFPRSRGIPLLQKKNQKTNCLNGKFPLTHQLETSQFYFYKPSLSSCCGIFVFSHSQCYTGHSVVFSSLSCTALWSQSSGWCEISHFSHSRHSSLRWKKQVWISAIT